MAFIGINGVHGVIQMKMSEGGCVVVPLEIRKKMGLKDGDAVFWEFVDGEARLTTPSARIRQAQASVRRFVPEGVSLADELIAERRTEAGRE